MSEDQLNAARVEEQGYPALSKKTDPHADLDLRIGLLTELELTRVVEQREHNTRQSSL
jgi:hypothetical protein